MKIFKNSSWCLVLSAVIAFGNSACALVKPNYYGDGGSSEERFRGVLVVALTDAIDTEKGSGCESAFTFDVVSVISGNATSNVLCLKNTGDLLKDTKYALVFDVGLSDPVSGAVVSSMRRQTVYPIQHHYRLGVCRDSSVFFRRPGILTEEIVSVTDGKFDRGLLGLYYQSNAYWGVLELAEVFDELGLKPIHLNDDCHKRER